jgi:hypothetical protein
MTLSRRTILRGAGACLALPMLEAMLPRRSSAQEAPKRFVGFFYPNGTDPNRWHPTPGALTAERLTPCLQDLKGFAAEGIWPAGSAMYSDVTAVSGIDHSGVCVDIHMPSLALCAHKGVKNNYTPGAPTLDQYLAEKLAANTRFRNLALSATGSTDIGQGNISFRADGQVESVIRSPKQLFTSLFGGQSTPDDRKQKRDASLLDGLLAQSKSLQGRLGAADGQRMEQYFQAVRELEQQVGGSASACTTPGAPSDARDWHGNAKLFVDLLVLALSCDLTRVITLQYSDSWGVNYSGYTLGSGKNALGNWSDHFISHKLDDTDRATDLDGLPRNEAQAIADERVVLTSRFKVRRFMYLLDALKKVKTPTGTLLDETMVLYASENGNGDSHARTNMPVLLAGHVGGFATGRALATSGQNTGSLHASIIQKFGLPAASYGNPAGKPIAEF